MKLKLYGYEYSIGISLQLIPETEHEEQLLRVLWKHGKVEWNHTGACVVMEHSPLKCGKDVKHD